MPSPPRPARRSGCTSSARPPCRWSPPAAGLVFGGDVNGRFKAWDQETGEVLWEINLGSAVTSFPISYAVDGKQYIAVGTGTASTASLFGRLTPEIRPSAGNNLFVFALP